MKLYITAMSVVLLLVFYVPVVLWLLWKIVRQPLPKLKKIGAVLGFLILAYAIPLGDVTVYSIAMAKACPTAGLKIYRTVEVDGYLTSIGGKEELKKLPYKYMESKHPGGEWVRWERASDGKVVYETIDKPTSQYEYYSGSWTLNKNLNVEEYRGFVKDRLSNEIIAEASMFNAIPGWFDRATVYSWYGPSVSPCGAPNYEFQNQVLIPKQ